MAAIEGQTRIFAPDAAVALHGDGDRVRDPGDRVEIPEGRLPAPRHGGHVLRHIGPIGATILAVELLKLPLAIWAASRHGWQKCVMVVFGLPLICVLTFQLVKDMAVYEMGVALTTNQMLAKATEEDEKKSPQLKGELADIEAKKTDREHKLAEELAARKPMPRPTLEQSLKRNDEERQDAIKPDRLSAEPV